MKITGVCYLTDYRDYEIQFGAHVHMLHVTCTYVTCYTCKHVTHVAHVHMLHVTYVTQGNQRTHGSIKSFEKINNF